MRTLFFLALALAVSACGDSTSSGSSGGGSCVADCEPKAIVEGGQVNASAIAVVRDQVFWGVEPQGGKPNALRRAPAGGGQVTDVATSNGKFVIASNGDALFYVREGELDRLDAGATTPTTLVAKLGGSSVVSVAANPTHVYWTDGSDIKRVGVGGGAPETVYSAPIITSIVVDGGNVYFAEGINNTLQTVAIDAPSPKTPRTLASQHDPMHFAIYDGTAYYASQRDMQIKSVPVTGGSETLLAETEAGPITIAADAAGIYFGTQKGIGRVPLSGGAPTSLTAVDSQSHMVLDITFDDSHVYWIDYSFQALFRAGK